MSAGEHEMNLPSVFAEDMVPRRCGGVRAGMAPVAGRRPRDRRSRPSRPAGARQTLPSRSGSGLRTQRHRRNEKPPQRLQTRASVAVWRDWTAIAFSGVLGLYLERRGNKLVKTLSAPLLATLAGLLFTNCGLTPSSSGVYSVVNKVLLPLAVPMLLLGADLRKVLTQTKRLLGCFLLGSLATCLSTVAAFAIVPLAPSLGAQDAWKVASALASRHIGGAVNYIAVSQTLEVTGDTVAAALAADNLICALYFMAIFWLSRKVGPEQGAAEASQQAEAAEEGGGEAKISVYEAGLAVAFSSVVCLVSSALASRVVGRPGTLIPLATLITVFAATIAPKRLQSFSGAGEGVALLIMQFFFATVGCSGSIHKVVSLAPLLFAFCLLQVFVHLGIVLAAGKLLGYSRKEIVLASNANVGGPTTAAAMCVAKGWRAYFIPSMLSGILGYTIATFVCIGLGVSVLKPMALR